MTDFGKWLHVEPSTPGQRLYLIRLACGDGVRRPESMREFAERVKRETGTEYLHSTVSMLERYRQGWRRKDMIAFAAVDPLERGPAWLGFGVSEKPTVAELSVPDPEPIKKKRLKKLPKSAFTKVPRSKPGTKRKSA